jgi:hypothetical protein
MATRPSDRPLPPRQPSPSPSSPGSSASVPVGERPLPARAPVAAQPRNPTVSRPERPAAARLGKPDARPMRVVYGASAVAAASVIAVGLFQPATTPVTADPTGQLAAQGGSGPGAAAANAPSSDVTVKHVIRYVHLKPGQTAPPGATVITRNAPAPRVVVTHNAPANQPRATQPPAARQPAPPPPPPPVRTRTSGHP